jgi:hypothetical protein
VCVIDVQSCIRDFEALPQHLLDMARKWARFCQCRCGHGVRACLALSVKQAGPSRLLRVVVDVKKVDWDLMGSIGHELHHAVEVLSEPSVNSSSAIYLFCRSAGEPSGDRFETPAAIKAGHAVRREARQAK